MGTPAELEARLRSVGSVIALAWIACACGTTARPDTTTPAADRAAPTAEILDVAVGAAHACVLRADRTVWCWGSDVARQTTGRAGRRAVGIPRRVDGIGGAVALWAGPEHTCAWGPELGLRCWGGRTRGPDERKDLPAGAERVDDGCAVVAGDLRCRFAGSDEWRAVDALAGAERWVRVRDAVCGLLAGGRVACSDGDGSATVTEGAEAIAGGSRLCAVRGGRVECTGGDLADVVAGCSDGCADAWSPVELPGAVTALSVSSARGCAVVGGDAIWCFGWDQVFEDTEVSIGGEAIPWARFVSETPTEARRLARIEGLEQIVVARELACARTASDVFCWGDGTSGQLGDRRWLDRESYHSPWPVSGVERVEALAAGEAHTCALREGDVWCWGANDGGQLGDGTTEDRFEPVRAGSLPAAQLLAAGAGHTCAVAGGQLWCWGAGSARPTRVDGLEEIDRMTSALGWTCVRHAGTHVSCVRPDGRGGFTRDRVEPLDGSDAVVGTGEDGLCGLRGGRLECVGADGATEVLLDGVAELTAGHVRTDDGRVLRFEWSFRPAANLDIDPAARGAWAGQTRAVDGVSEARDVAPGCAVVDSGGVACWGSRQLTGRRRNDPAADELRRIPGIDDARAVVTGGGHACVLYGDGDVACWGRYARGQIARPLPPAEVSTPVRVRMP